MAFNALHEYILGLLVGWGVAIPIGPMNLEIIRRNLTFGWPSGLSFGLGICAADVTYLLLLNAGALVWFMHSQWMGVIGVLGSLVLFWFAYQTFTMPPATYALSRQAPEALWRQVRDGYLLTLLSPFTILFWASMSSQIAVSSQGAKSMVWMVLGVMSGTVSWMGGLNTVLHFTHHRLSPTTMHYLNLSGGVILLGFAIFGLWHSIHTYL